MSKLRQGILALLVGSGCLLTAAVFSAGMGVLLDCLGDETGAAVSLGAAGVTAAGFAVTQILLVTLLALAFLRKNMEGDAFTEGTPHA